MNNNMYDKMKLVVIGIYLLSLTEPLVADAQAEAPLAQADAIVEEAICATNKARETEGKNLPPVCWNKTLACYAEDYAKKRACDCKLEHSNIENPTLCYGENLATCTGEMTVTTAVEMWYAEKPDYTYETGECTSGKMCGHYTQVVWKDSTQIGCAKTKCDNGGTFIICNYWPPGNIVGQKPY